LQRFHILAEELTELFADDEKDAKNIGIVSMGAAAENSLIGMVNFTFYDMKRKKIRLKQAGRGGIGTVMRDKKIKAIVARVEGVSGNLNNVADLETIKEKEENTSRRCANWMIISARCAKKVLPTS
jgi:aldehyde:ferredoxin oxidoreductase